MTTHNYIVPLKLGKGKMKHQVVIDGKVVTGYEKEINTMTTYEQLRKRIAELVPGTMELKFGCEMRPKEVFEFPQYTFADKFIFLNHSGGGQIADTGDYDEYNLFLLEPESGEIYKDDSWIFDNFEILGIPPTLSDVLLAISKANPEKEYLIMDNGMIREYLSNDKICTLDLTLPFHQQTEETIRALNELLA